MIINCKKQHLEIRCKQRNYTLEEVKDCILSSDGDNITVDTDHPSYPKNVKQIEIKKPERPPLPELPKAPELFGPPKPLPPLWERVSNFVSSTADHLSVGMPMCSQEQVEERYSICQSCEFFSNGSCSKCGCPLIREKKYISKLSWANEECPVGKWGKVKPS